MITTVDSTAALLSALKTAAGGDVIQLAGGVYSGVSISDVRFDSEVIITSADPFNTAVVANLSVKNASGITFANLDFTVSGPTAATAGVQVSSSDHIHFDHVHVHGSLDGDPSNDSAGMLIRSSSDILVAHSEFEQVYWGVAHLDTDRLQVVYNDFHDIRVDAVRGGGSNGVAIVGNHFWNFRPSPGDHGDAVQFWTTNTDAPTAGFEVSDNRMERGDGGVFQGVFVSDRSGHLPFANLTIKGNLISGGMYNGIDVDGATNVDIEDNIVQGFTDMKSWVRLGNIDGITLANNKANAFLIGDTVTNLSNTASQTVGLASDAGAAMAGLWDAAHGIVTAAPPAQPSWTDVTPAAPVAPPPVAYTPHVDPGYGSVAIDPANIMSMFGSGNWFL